MPLFIIIAAIISVSLYACSGPSETTYYAKNYGENWPFVRFESVTVSCKRERPTMRPMVTMRFDDGKTKYGLNGAALGVGGYPHFRPFMARNEYDTYKSPIPKDWIKTGLKICDPDLE